MCPPTHTHTIEWNIKSLEKPQDLTDWPSFHVNSQGDRGQFTADLCSSEMLSRSVIQSIDYGPKLPGLSCSSPEGWSYYENTPWGQPTAVF